MPNYDYVCDGCGHAWEHFQSMSDRPLKSCPKCAKRKARRLIGAGAGLIFKGSGFYVTDYKKRPESSAESSATSTPASASGGKTESSSSGETAAKASSKKDNAGPKQA